MRDFLKRRGEPLASSIAWRLRRRAVRLGCIVLAYHNIRPPNEAEAGERALHIPWERFRRHLDVIQECADVVSLSAPYATRQPGQRLRVVLTFDDAYSAAVELGLPEMARRGLPATMFVAPGLLEGRSFWWDQLADPASGELPPETRDRLLALEAGQQDRVRVWASRCGAPWVESLPRWATGASIAALRMASKLPGISLGGHSWSHPNLTALDDSALSEEMIRPRRWLRDQALGEAEWLAYPYGLATNVTAAAAKDAGYSGALMVSGGFITDSSSDFLMPRLNVPAGLTRAGLRLRLSGWLAR